MSANLLEKVTPLTVVPSEARKFGLRPLNAYLYDSRETPIAEVYGAEDEEPKACAQLLALAYDHALILAATARGRLLVSSVFAEQLVTMARVSLDGQAWFDLPLDPFGCPALTPELRTALQTALGLESGK